MIQDIYWFSLHKLLDFKENFMKHRPDECCFPRRKILTQLMASAVVGLSAAADVPDQERRDRFTPDQIVEKFLNGNRRFVSGQMRQRNWLRDQKLTAGGQYPAGVFLTCIDSRAPVEIICDLGIGEAFNARVAGNAVNDDILGSLEFATKVAGAKAVFIMGHTECGAIKGAIEGVAMGNLTLLLARIRNSIAATHYDGERTSSNYEFVNLVARNHVIDSVKLLRKRSPIMRDLEQAGTIRIVGSMYDLKTGTVSLV